MRTLFRRIFLALFVAGLAGAIAYGLMPAPVEADFAEVTRGSIRETVDQDGKTRIRERYIVSAPLAGRLQRIELEPGDEVNAGETVVAVIEPLAPELLDERSLKQAEANVQAAEARLQRTTPLLEEAIASLEFAESDLRRSQEALRRNPQAVTESEIENKEMLRRTRAALVRAAQRAQEIAQFELDQAEAALVRSRPSEEPAVPPEGSTEAERAPYPENANGRRNLVIRAPINGRVFRVLQESTAVVTPGQELIEVGDPLDLEVEIDVLSRDAVKIKPGADVLLEEWGGEQPLNGEVRLVEPSGFTKISTLGVEEQRVNVIVDLVDPPHEREKLNDGFRVEARIVVAEADNVLKVPTSALFRADEDWAVFRVEEGVARQRIVKVGLENGLQAEVTTGLAEGDEVVTHPGDNIVDGVRVRPR
ncbi:MAG TPA: efflux RND transporter periplasmic adaptor subunit [Lacipirellula sp.]